MAGCSNPGPSAANYGVREIVGAERTAVLDAAELALIHLGHSIDRRVAQTGVLTTRPTPIPPGDGPLRRTALLSSNLPLRRVIEVRVEPGQGAQRVYCKVLIQEQATEAHRMLSLDQNRSDVPTQTPIERDAGTTIEQNTVWRTLRRDKNAEREILSAILDRTGGAREEVGQ